MKDGLPALDSDWCIGCGVCMNSCPSEAIRMVRREDVPAPMADLKRLSRDRLAARGESGKS
jgi:ferredoxin